MVLEKIQCLIINKWLWNLVEANEKSKEFNNLYNKWVIDERKEEDNRLSE